MFRWFCLVAAVIATATLGWMVNDLRLEIKSTVKTLNEHLPAILEKTEVSTEALAELSEDVRQLKELAGVTAQARDKTLVAYGNSVLNFIESSGGTIGTRKLVGKGLKDPLAAREWAIGGRKKALLLTVVVGSHAEFLKRLCERPLGGQWYIQLPNKEPITLAEWLKANHPETKALGEK